MGFPTVVARPGAPPPARDGPAAALAKPAARALVDLGVRLGAARRAAGGDPDRAAVLHRIWSPIRSGHPGKRRMAQTAHIRLAEPAFMALSPNPRCTRRAGSDHHPGGAGQTVVGHSPTVRVATTEVDRAACGAAVAVDAGGRDPLRARYRGTQYPVRLHIRIQLLHRALLRGMGIHRRFRYPRADQIPEDGRRSAFSFVSHGAAHLPRRHPSRTTGHRRAGRHRPRTGNGESSRRAGTGRRRRTVRRSAHRRPDTRWFHPPCGVAVAAGT